MNWASRFDFRIGMAPINAFLMRLKLMLNFHSENPAAFRLIFMVEIQ